MFTIVLNYNTIVNKFKRNFLSVEIIYLTFEILVVLESTWGIPAFRRAQKAL